MTPSGTDCSRHEPTHWPSTCQSASQSIAPSRNEREIVFQCIKKAAYSFVLVKTHLPSPWHSKKPRPILSLRWQVVRVTRRFDLIKSSRE